MAFRRMTSALRSKSDKDEEAVSPRGGSASETLDYDRVLKSGYLQKKKMGKNWKRRYCMLTQHHLAYFEDLEAKNSRQPLGSLSLVNVAVKLTVVDRVEVVALICPSATYYFDAQSPEANKQWWEQVDFALRNMRSAGGLVNSSGGKFVYDDEKPVANSSFGGGGGGGGGGGSGSFATEGNLRKQGNQKLVKDWKMRYFVLTEMGSLLYYKQKGDSQPLGIIKVQSAKTKLAPETGKEYAFSVDTGDRVFRMQAASAQEMGRWIDCINRAGGHVTRASGFGEPEGQSSSMSSRELQKTTSVVRSVGVPGVSTQQRGKSGHLMKMGNNVRGKSDWKQRWFVLEGDNLRYYPTEQSDEALGTIKLVTASAVMSDLRERCVQINTPNRKYYVQAPTDQDAAEWLQQINLARDASGNSAVAAGSPEDGEVLSGMLKKMGNNKIKDWRDRYCVMNGTSFKYYKTDKTTDSPLGEVNLLMASAKDEGNNRFSLVLPQRKYVFECKNAAELQRWMKAIQDATVNLYNNLKAGESSKKKDSKDVSKFAENKQRVLDLMKSGPGNQICADCGKPNPRWASVNLGVFICLECSGIHRSLGVHISKVRSADLDEWEDWQVEVMTSKGNRLQNEIYEKKGVGEIKPGPEASAVERDRYIRQKWVACAFADPSRVEKPAKDMRLSVAAPVRLYREGFLTKQGHKRKNWKKRWFVLKDNELSYYEQRGDEDAKGRIPLDDPTVSVQALSGGPYPFMFEVTIGDVPYAMYAQDEKERCEWIDTIERVIQKNVPLDDEEDEGSMEAEQQQQDQHQDEDADFLVVPAISSKPSGPPILDEQAVLNDRRDMEGIMHKMGELDWKTAYFILSQSDLYYFVPSSMEIAGVVCVKGCAVKSVAKRADRSFCFLVTVPGEKVALFAVDTAEEQRNWMEAVSNAASKQSRMNRSFSLGLEGMNAASPPKQQQQQQQQQQPDLSPTRQLPSPRQQQQKQQQQQQQQQQQVLAPTPSSRQPVPAKRLPDNPLVKSDNGLPSAAKPRLSPRPVSVDPSTAASLTSPRKGPPAGAVSVMPSSLPSSGITLKKAPVPGGPAPKKMPVAPSKTAPPAPPKKPLPGPPPKKAPPQLQDAKSLSNSGFGLLGLDVPQDVDMSSSEEDNPYAAFSARPPNEEQEFEEEDLIY